MTKRWGYVISGTLLLMALTILVRQERFLNPLNLSAFGFMILFDLADLDDPDAGRVSLSAVFAIPLFLHAPLELAGAMVIGSRSMSYLVRRIGPGAEVAPGSVGAVLSVIAGWAAVIWIDGWARFSSQGAAAGLVVGTALLFGDAAGRAATGSMLYRRFGVTDPLRWARVELPLLAAALSLGVLALLLIDDLGAWSLLLTALVLSLVRQAYGLLFDMRRAYHATLRTLVRAVESQNERMRGHAEGTASIARRIALKMRLSSASVERVGDAALLHDIGELGEGERRSAASTVRGLEHLEEVVRVLDARERAPFAGKVPSDVLRDAYVVALSSDVECMMSGREHESASTSGSLSRAISPSTRARIVSAAVSLGFPIPAVP